MCSLGAHVTAEAPVDSTAAAADAGCTGTTVACVTAEDTATDVATTAGAGVAADGCFEAFDAAAFDMGAVAAVSSDFCVRSQPGLGQTKPASAAESPADAASSRKNNSSSRGKTPSVGSSNFEESARRRWLGVLRALGVATLKASILSRAPLAANGV